MRYFLKRTEVTYEINPPETDRGEVDSGEYGKHVYPHSLHRTSPGGLDVEILDDGLYGGFRYDGVAVGATAYLVVVEYIDGDTFGFSGYWCVPCIRTNRHEAEQFLKYIETNQGRVFRWPWQGYFANYEGGRVEALEVLP